MGFENAPKMSRPSETEVSGTRPGVDPARPAAKFRGAGAWALGLGIPAFCFWYIAPVVIVIGVIGIVQGARTGDKRDRGFAIAGLTLALLGLLLAGMRLLTSVAATL